MDCRKAFPQLSVALIAVLSLAVSASFASAAIAAVPRGVTAIGAAAAATAATVSEAYPLLPGPGGCATNEACEKYCKERSDECGAWMQNWCSKPENVEYCAKHLSSYIVGKPVVALPEEAQPYYTATVAERAVARAAMQKVAPPIAAVPTLIAMPTDILLEEMVMGKLSKLAEEKYKLTGFMAREKCVNESGLVDLIYGYWKALAVPVQELCDPLRERVKACEKPMCEGVKEKAEQCPPTKEKLLEACLERMEDESRRNVEETKKNAARMCEEQWQWNEHSFRQNCDELSKPKPVGWMEPEDYCSEEKFVAKCLERSRIKPPEVTPTPIAVPLPTVCPAMPYEAYEKCKMQGGVIEERKDDRGCVIAVQCITPTPAAVATPQLFIADVWFGDSTWPRKTYYTTDEINAAGGKARIWAKVVDESGPASPEEGTRVMSHDEFGIILDMVFDPASLYYYGVVSIAATPTPGVHYIKITAQKAGLTASGEGKIEVVSPTPAPSPEATPSPSPTPAGNVSAAQATQPLFFAVVAVEAYYRQAKWTCYDGYAEELGGPTSCKGVEVWRKYAEESCAGRCSKETGKCGVNTFNVYEECSLAAPTCPTLPPFEEMERKCVSEGGKVLVKTDDMGCKYFDCVFPQPAKLPTATPSPTTQACPIITPPSPELEKKCAESGGKLVPKYDERGCIIAYTCAYPREVMPVLTPVPTLVKEPKEICRRKWLANKENFARMCEQGPPSYEEQRREVCDKNYYLKKCRKRMTDELVESAAVQRVRWKEMCEREAEANLPHMAQFCLEYEDSYGACLEQSRKGCEIAKEQLAKCKNIVSSEDAVRDMIEGAVHKFCKYAQYKPVNVTKPKPEELPPAEVIPVIVAVEKDISFEDAAKLEKLAEKTLGLYAIARLRIYSLTIRAERFGELKKLPFVLDAKLDHVQRVIQVHERAEERMRRAYSEPENVSRILEALELAKGELLEDFEPWIAHEQDRLLNATGGIKAVKEGEAAKDLLYRLSWFFGGQGDRERAEAAQLEAEHEKLNRTTASLSQLVEQVSDVTLRAALLAQIEELKDRAQAVADMARRKRGSAGGFIDVIKSLLGLG